MDEEVERFRKVSVLHKAVRFAQVQPVRAES